MHIRLWIKLRSVQQYIESRAEIKKVPFWLRCQVHFYNWDCPVLAARRPYPFDPDMVHMYTDRCVLPENN